MSVRFIAVGDAVNAATSADGITWSNLDLSGLGHSDNIWDVIYAGGNWVLCSGPLDSNALIYYSADGVTFNIQANIPSTVGFLGIMFQDPTYITCDGNGSICTSTDLLAWAVNFAVLGDFQPLNKITFGAGLYVAVGGGGDIGTSPDLITWTTQASGTVHTLRGLVWSGALFVATGDAGTILTSPDGIAWTARVSPTTNRINAVTHGAGRFVAVCDYSADNVSVIYSDDGITWHASTNNFGVNKSARGVTYDGVLWCLVGGQLLVSGNGATATDVTGAWTPRAMDFQATRFEAVFGIPIPPPPVPLTFSRINAASLGVVALPNPRGPCGV